jgi:hypothetical protein
MRCFSLNLSFFFFGNSRFHSQHAWDEAIITIATFYSPPPSRFEVVIKNNEIIINEVPPLLSLPSHFINYWCPHELHPKAQKTIDLNEGYPQSPKFHQ